MKPTNLKQTSVAKPRKWFQRRRRWHDPREARPEGSQFRDQRSRLHLRAFAKNIEATILGRPLKPFRYKMMGQLASIGHRTGVAMVFGIKFSGFIAWWFWRSVYLIKLPRLAKKLRVMVSWTLDLFFAQEIEQMITVRDIEELSG
jgi:hypothetical protein